jgi:beta-glucuronidase
VHENPAGDAAGLTDFIEWNEYYESWYGGGLNSLAESLGRLAGAFPGKALVVSEYGLCECAPGNPSGDAKRVEILKTHTDAYRKNRAVAGAIFFDYNDYRTHIGDKGRGAFRQRVHGVTDLLGRRKPSWEALRRELSPVRALVIGDTVRQGDETSVSLRVVTRSLEDDMPAYTLRGYRLAWTALNALDQPVESGSLALPDLPPGSDRRWRVSWPEFEGLRTLRAVIWRPTGYAVLEEERPAAKP